MEGLAFLGVDPTVDVISSASGSMPADESRGGGIYLAILLGALALPFVSALSYVPGWLRERRAIGRLRHETIESSIGAKPAHRTARQEMLAQGLTEGEINAARRVLIARRKDVEAAQLARNVEALRLADVRRWAKSKVVAAKRAAARSSVETV